MGRLTQNVLVYFVYLELTLMSLNLDKVQVLLDPTMLAQHSVLEQI